LLHLFLRIIIRIDGFISGFKVIAPPGGYSWI